ncbi:hypothetical protein FLL45_19985 [Aliikangiella marina]|uniref:STAS domain-containing protein n=1 Tax=Aliikangiella marina TaxID=1712262 RepID=A0A545T2J3_9GAMM|nr:hypothetical protein [Aliikangiella marina]TQV71437.1 hypothetical protein FLL45_19985 [Aliikangiella marina]
MSGSIYAASIDNIRYIKFLGTVRYSHCGGLENHIDQMFSGASEIEAIVIDLEDADILDSTALGLLARVAIEYRKLADQRPVIFLKKSELYNIIKRVCFDQVFELVFDDPKVAPAEMTELVDGNQNEQQTLKRVVEAHRYLAKINKENEKLYTDITSAMS